MFPSFFQIYDYNNRPCTRLSSSLRKGNSLRIPGAVAALAGESRPREGQTGMMCQNYSNDVQGLLL